MDALVVRLLCPGMVMSSDSILRIIELVIDMAQRNHGSTCCARAVAAAMVAGSCACAASCCCCCWCDWRIRAGPKPEARGLGRDLVILPGTVLCTAGAACCRRVCQGQGHIMSKGRGLGSVVEKADQV